MSPRSRLLCVVIAAAAAAAPRADGLEPGSVLVIPYHRAASNPATFTAVAVTNLNVQPVSPQNGLGGTTAVHYEYVNAVPSPQPGLATCHVSDRVEVLTPGDTRVVVTSCDNPGGFGEGYLVVTALDPTAFDRPWSHDWLVGSGMVLSATHGIWYQNAIPFDSPRPAQAATDVDGDGQLDFDGVEYEGIPDMLLLDGFVSEFFASVALINLSGGTAFTANVKLDIFNDNEQPLSATFSFRCWSRPWLADISLVFDPVFLRQNTNQDPAELAISCGAGPAETLECGWLRIRGLNHSSTAESCPDAAILGAMGHGNTVLNGARRLWESKALQLDGDFLKTGTDDPECGKAKLP